MAWRARRLAVGRVVLLISDHDCWTVPSERGRAPIARGPMERWFAAIGAGVIAVFIAAGVLASAAALFSDLPGASIAERMTVQAEIEMRGPQHGLMLLLTGALVVA